MPDGYEYFILETDPLKVDTDDNDIWDGDEDIDEDGLINIKEYKLETNPFMADTDEDGLLDGDEVYKYSTNPLLFDTDNDGISDGDEIELSLDPNNPYTFGVPDSTYTVWQVAKEDTLKNINDENNIYQLSVSLLASNNVQNYLACQTSSYSVCLEDNRAILGEPVELLYKAGEVKEANIAFDLNPEYLNIRPDYYPELNLGLDRYCIFTYNEELNLLYPIETTYSAETNTLSASVNTIGTFCVVDLESLIYDLGIEIDDIDLEKESTLYGNSRVASNAGNRTSGNEVIGNFEDLSLEEMKAMVRDLSETQIKNVETNQSNILRSATSSMIKQVDLVLVLDTTASMSPQIGSVKANLVRLINDLRKEGISLYVSIVDYKDITCDGINSTKINYPKNVDFMNNIDDMLDVMNSISISGGGDNPETVIDGLGATTNLGFRKNASKYAFVITDIDYKVDNNYGFTSLNEVANKLNKLGVKSSVVTYSEYASIYSPLYSETDGIWINLSGTFSTDMYNFILEKTNQGAKYNAIVASGLVPVVLDEELTKGGEIDTDGDGLSDSDEVKWEYIKIGSGADGSSKIILPTLKTLLNDKLGYSTEGLEKIPLLNLILQINVLPINSSPISEDSDGDFYKDSWDINPLERDAMLIVDDDIRDTFLEEDQLYSTYMMMNTNPIKITDAVMKTKTLNIPTQSEAKYAEYTRPTHVSGKETECDEFEIEVKRNSDYKFTVGYVEGRKSYYVKVYEKNGDVINYNKKLNPVEKYGNNQTFSLVKGKKYAILVQCKTENIKNYVFTVEQDNWVYAPNGGKIYGGQYSSLYVNPQQFWKALGDVNDLVIVPKEGSTLQESIEAAEHELGLKVTNVDKFMAGASGLGLGTTVTCIIIAPATGGCSLLGVVSGISTGCTLVTTPSTIGAFLKMAEKYDFEEACSRGGFYLENMHAIATTSYINYWEAWEAASYINKYVYGVRGRLQIGVTSDEIIEWCNW